ncbi:uncharacterized protein LOC125235462 [Leguminivora glycinivorella]|uniref:uncharacterized protein LOC125235462 n=1 Tax=Leguminivora glycinivorella TaxID=1035111 RepID=UPI00200D234C|nr:uncharacterized protein LOC125235462 [Leguminivora glycinivorella]
MSFFNKSVEMRRKTSWMETGTAIFAFLNFISASVGVLLCLNVLFMYVYEAITHTDRIDAFMWSACIGTNFIANVSLVFAVLLYLGINRNKPCFILAYFIFGVIVVISLVAGLVVINQQEYAEKKLREVFCEYYEAFIYGTVGICIMYALLLTMICRTWVLMTSWPSGDRRILVNDYYESDWRSE